MNLSKIRNAADLLAHRIRMRKHYRMTFHSSSGKVVLRDLMTYCGFDDDLFHKDPRVEAYRLGQRRVLLRIRSWMNMSLEELEALSKPESGIEGDIE